MQGLKRLMTKCQQYFVTDPSRSVDFQRQETDPAPEPSQEAGAASLRTVAFTSSKESALAPETGGLQPAATSSEDGAASASGAQ